jgi:hypothetical protein
VSRIDAAFQPLQIADYTWHNNRRTFCSWLAMAGVSVKEIQVVAGHKTITRMGSVWPPVATKRP